MTIYQAQAGIKNYNIKIILYHVTVTITLTTTTLQVRFEVTTKNNPDTV
jgi:hypothetical protein